MPFFNYPGLTVAENTGRQQLLVAMGIMKPDGNPVTSPPGSPNVNNAVAMEAMVTLFNAQIQRHNANPANANDQKPPIAYDPNVGYTPQVGQQLLTAVQNFKGTHSYGQMMIALGKKEGTLDAWGSSFATDAQKAAAVRTALREGGFPPTLADNPDLLISLLDQAPSIVSGYDKFKASNQLASVATTQAWQTAQAARNQAGASGAAPVVPGAPVAGAPTSATGPSDTAVQDATTVVRTALQQLYAGREGMPGDMKDMPNPGTGTGPMDTATRDSLHFGLSRIKGYLAMEGGYGTNPEMALDGTYTKQVGERMRAAIARMPAEKKAEFYSKVGGEAALNTVFSSLDVLAEKNEVPDPAANNAPNDDVLDNAGAAGIAMDPQMVRTGGMVRRIMTALPPSVKGFLSNLANSPIGQLLISILQMFMPGLDLSSFLDLKNRPGEDGVIKADQWSSMYKDALNDPSVAGDPAKLKAKLLEGVDGFAVRSAAWLSGNADKRAEMERAINESFAEAEQETTPEAKAAKFGELMEARMRALMPAPAPGSDPALGNGQPGNGGTGGSDSDVEPGAPGRDRSGPVGRVDVPPSRDAQDIVATTSTFFSGLPKVEGANLDALVNRGGYDAAKLYGAMRTSEQDPIPAGTYLVMGLDAQTRQAMGLGNNVIITRSLPDGSVESRIMDVSTIPGGPQNLPTLLNQSPNLIRVATPEPNNCWRVRALSGGDASPLPGRGTQADTQQYNYDSQNRSYSCPPVARQPERPAARDEGGGEYSGSQRRQIDREPYSPAFLEARRAARERGTGGYDENGNYPRTGLFPGIFDRAARARGVPDEQLYNGFNARSYGRQGDSDMYGDARRITGSNIYSGDGYPGPDRGRHIGLDIPSDFQGRVRLNIDGRF